MTQLQQQLQQAMQTQPAELVQQQAEKMMPMFREEFVRQFKSDELKLLNRFKNPEGKKEGGLTAEEFEGLVNYYDDASIYREAEKIRVVYRKLGGQFSNANFGRPEGEASEKSSTEDDSAKNIPELD